MLPWNEFLTVPLTRVEAAGGQGPNCVHLVPSRPLAIGGANGLLREPQIWEAGRMDLVLALSLEGCVSLGVSHASPRFSALSSVKGDDG